MKRKKIKKKYGVPHVVLGPGAGGRLEGEGKGCGTVTLLDLWGTEKTIADSARVSYQKGTRKKSSDARLVRRLYLDSHTSPLEQVKIRLHLKMPLFVAAQWTRHRMANVNQMSARYSEMPDDYYLPDVERMQGQSLLNKQGSDGKANAWAQQLNHNLKLMCDLSHELYQGALERGLTRELARCHLTENWYTNLVWCTDLHNLLHFLKLRMDTHAQWEIRQYANFIGHEIVAKWVPNIWQAFEDKTLHSNLVSRRELDAYTRLVMFPCPFAEVAEQMELTGREKEMVQRLLEQQHIKTA